MAIARPRSRGSRKTLVRIDRVDGMINAPPMPMKARVAISCVAVVDSAASTEPRPNRAMPSCSAPLRPKRSDRLPVVRRRPAKTSAYESMIHCTWLLVASRSVTSEGMATLRIVLSITITSSDKHRTASVSQRRACTAGSSGAASGGGR
jgi:hypothetical protein